MPKLPLNDAMAGDIFIPEAAGSVYMPGMEGKDEGMGYKTSHELPPPAVIISLPAATLRL